MNYDDGANALPIEMSGDPWWRIKAYRHALFAADQRGSELRADSPPYFPAPESIELDRTPGPGEIANLPQPLPLP